MASKGKVVSQVMANVWSWHFSEVAPPPIRSAFGPKSNSAWHSRIVDAGYIRKEGGVLSFAGLWDEWTDIESGDEVLSCAIIVTSANKRLSYLHDRMPVMLAEKTFEPWLSGKAGTEVLKPAPDSWIRYWQVSRRVNSTRGNDDAGLITPV